MNLLIFAVAALIAGSASFAPASPATTPTADVQNADTTLAAYVGTYRMQGPTREITLRIWADADGVMNGELVELGQRATFRPGDVEHKFVHSELDQAWLVFTVENGRATKVTMHQRGREMSGIRVEPPAP